MKKSSYSLALIILLLWENSIAQDAELNNSNAMPDIQVLFPDAPAKSYVTVLCTSCHDLSRVVVQQKDYTLWENTISRMVGGIVSDEQLDLIVGYLAENFGPENPITKFPLNINTLSEDVLLRLPGINADIAIELVNYIEFNENIDSINEIKFLITSEEDWKALTRLVGVE